MSSPNELFWAARHPPADPTTTTPFHNKTILVTGANSGLGHDAATKYASLGANPLTLAVRTPEKGAAAAKGAIVAATGCSPDIFIIETFDLASFSSVQAFAERVIARVPALHVVQARGGIAIPGFGRSEDGYEMAFQVNVLANALLGMLLLLPKLQETSATTAVAGRFVPHLSIVNSIAYVEVKLEWIAADETLIERINDEKRFDMNSQYCMTNMGRNHPLVLRLFMVVFYFIFGRSAELGSRTLVSATDLGVESLGRFWTKDEFLP
ncbi:hypothetical protein B0T17DRAFT_494884 [Bombardia bombarda]|uniref:NAD(P)-binding protein n=1 Tax=Bombardia bombarda TaxID=252184 RepID=A0AA39WUK5_9PEZI|nr:hypothetical protein B0T17DRAFT_494884 [Bombardia bombarda]